MTKENCCTEIVKDKQANQLDLKATILLDITLKREIVNITTHIGEEVVEDALII